MVVSHGIYQTQTVPASSAAKVGKTGQIRLMAAYLYPAAANSIVEFKNAATDTGTVLLTISALANVGTFIDLTEIGGLEFSTAMFCKPAGTGSIAYVWFDQA